MQINTAVSRASHIKQIFVILSAVLSAQVWLLPAYATPGWILDRISQAGKEVITASKDGVLISYPQQGYNIVATAPNWDMTWFNPDSKTKFMISLAAYRMRKGLPPDPPAISKTPRGSTTCAGVKAFKESILPEQSDELRFLSSVNEGDNAKLQRIDFYYSEPVDLPQRALLFLSTFMGTRNYKCFPLSNERVFKDGHAYKFWYTKTIKQTDIPLATFAVPANCAKVNNHYAVTAGGGFSKDIVDMAQELKVGKGFGQK